MVLVRVLGLIDMSGALLFLLLAFGITPFLQLSLFVAGLLLVKSLFILTGEIVLSLVDLFAALCLLLSLLFVMPMIIVWVFSFVLIAKSIVSFM